MLVSPCHYDGYLDPTSVENRIWGDGIGTCRCDVDGSWLLSGAMLEACGLLSYTNLSRPVHGATTHGNSTIISLYGYGLAQYVVEFSLGIPNGCAGKLLWQNR
jgi:hypothetical protein